MEGGCLGNVPEGTKEDIPGMGPEKQLCFHSLLSVAV